MGTPAELLHLTFSFTCFPRFNPPKHHKMTRIVNDTESECEEAFFEAYEEWETKWADVPESENKVAQAKKWVKSFEKEYSIGLVCLLRRKRLMLGQHAQATNWLDETPDMSKPFFDHTLLSWIRSLTKKAGQWWALSENNDGQVRGQPEGQTDQLAKPPIHPPGYTEACGSSTSHLVEKGIQQLTNQYWDCAYKASRIYDDRPPLTRMMERILLLVEHHDRHGRSYAWIFQRKICADTGGCCGRSCGCCEQPLITYLRPVSDTDLEKKEVGVYGHCGDECPCCIRVRRRYRPDPCLPKPTF